MPSTGPFYLHLAIRGRQAKNSNSSSNSDGGNSSGQAERELEDGEKFIEESARDGREKNKQAVRGEGEIYNAPGVPEPSEGRKER